MEIVNANGGSIDPRNSQNFVTWSTQGNHFVSAAATELVEVMDLLEGFIRDKELAGEGLEVMTMQLTPMMRPHPIITGQGIPFFHLLVCLRRKDKFHDNISEAVMRLTETVKKAVGAV